MKKLVIMVIVGMLMFVGCTKIVEVKPESNEHIRYVVVGFDFDNFDNDIYLSIDYTDENGETCNAIMKSPVWEYNIDHSDPGTYSVSVHLIEEGVEVEDLYIGIVIYLDDDHELKGGGRYFHNRTLSINIIN